MGVLFSLNVAHRLFRVPWTGVSFLLLCLNLPRISAFCRHHIALPDTIFLSFIPNIWSVAPLPTSVIQPDLRASLEHPYDKPLMSDQLICLESSSERRVSRVTCRSLDVVETHTVRLLYP
ncbi:hypothetical protein PM082_008643 [Marasmius tenuissimus]|nr:hypothetical protein PM082_008643 [Marasmius tenuissimus]